MADEGCSNSPDHQYEPDGLTVAQLIERLKVMPPDAKILVETSDEDEGYIEMLGKVTEVQHGRDTYAYLRVDRTSKQLMENWQS